MNGLAEGEAVSRVFLDHLEEFDRALADLHRLRAHLIADTAITVDWNRIAEIQQHLIALHKAINPGGSE